MQKRHLQPDASGLGDKTVNPAHTDTAHSLNMQIGHLRTLWD